MKLKYEITASVGKYKKNGEEKTRYMRIGSVFEREDGTQCIKLDSVPVGNEWGGWANLYSPRIKKEGYSVAKEAVKSDDGDGLQDSIPF